MSSHHPHLPGGTSASSYPAWTTTTAATQHDGSSHGNPHYQPDGSRQSAIAEASHHTPHGTAHTQFHASGSNIPRPFAPTEDLSSTESQTNLAVWERPRVRAEGPGGPDVKQGARIACLDCRLAKIRCSAPTDGIVPCKRCARHDRECVFEKHRRGRKPGRWNGAGPPASGPAQESRHSGSASSSPVEFRHSRPEQHVEPSVMAPAPPSQHHHAHPALETATSNFGHAGSQWSSNAPRKTSEYGRTPSSQMTSQVHSSHRANLTGRPDGAQHPSDHFLAGNAAHESSATGRSSLGTPGSMSSYSPLVPTMRSSSATTTSQSSLRSAAWPGPISMPPPVRMHSANTLEHHTPGTASIPRSWNDFASPSRSLLSPSMGLGYGTPGSGAGTTQQGVHLNPSTSHAAQSVAGTPKRKASEDGQSYMGESHRLHVDEAKRSRTYDEAANAGSGGAGAGAGSGPRDATSAASTSEEEDGDEVDQLDEDALGEGADNEDVLQIPLRLLAHASEGMAATKAGEQKQSTGAATIGLVSPPRPRPRPSMLSHLVAAAGAHHPMRDRTLPGLPHLSTMTARSNMRTQMSPPAPRPNIAGRSRSYTAIEAAGVQARLKQEVMLEAIQHAAAAERSETLGTSSSPAPSSIIVGNLMVAVKDASNAIIDVGAYEYRGGKTRSKAGITGSATTPTSASGPEVSQERLEELSNGHGEMAAARSRSSRPLSRGRAPDSESPAPPTGTSHTGSNTGSGSGGIRRSKSSARVGPKRTRAGPDDVELGSGAHIAGGTPVLDANGESPDELEAGASHPDYWTLSPFASKLDVEKGDPVDVGFASMSELRDLFDIFFNRINPLLNLLDPFLHSVSYTRSRSALLTTVIAAFAARLSDSQRDAELAVLMERHWRETLVPEVLLGGYKSVELSQAFLLLSLYGKPTQRLADDRSWQYLGYAIRIGTEIGINRRVAPSESLQDSEQLRRRIRNRWRTWMCLFISDRTLSAQTGRPFTISTDELITSVGTNFHRADWALPQDVSLVSLVQLRRLIAQHESAFNNFVTAALVSQGATSTQPHVELQGRRRSGDLDLRELESFRQRANTDLERWKEAWCVSAADEAHVQSLAMADFLVRWRPTAMLHYRHARLYLNSIVLQTFEQHSGEEYSIPTALECWDSATALIDVLLDDITQEDLESSPNQTAIMATWTAMTALRLTKLDRAKHPWVDRAAIIDRAKRLARALARAGRSPAHRNGAAGPYGSWLRSVLELYIPESERADQRAVSPLLRRQPDGILGASKAYPPGEASSSPSASSALVSLVLDEGANDRSSSEPGVAASVASSEATLLANTNVALSGGGEMAMDNAVLTVEPVNQQPKVSSGSLNGLSDAEQLFAAGLPLTHSSNSPSDLGSLSKRHEGAGELADSGPMAAMPAVVQGTIASAMPAASNVVPAPSNGAQQAPGDPENNIDMAFDYLTAFNSPSSGFPGGLWQPQSAWGGMP